MAESLTGGMARAIMLCELRERLPLGAPKGKGWAETLRQSRPQFGTTLWRDPSGHRRSKALANLAGERTEEARASYCLFSFVGPDVTSYAQLSIAIYG